MGLYTLSHPLLQLLKRVHTPHLQCLKHLHKQGRFVGLPNLSLNSNMSPDSVVDCGNWEDEQRTEEGDISVWQYVPCGQPESSKKATVTPRKFTILWSDIHKIIDSLHLHNHRIQSATSFTIYRTSRRRIQATTRCAANKYLHGWVDLKRFWQQCKKPMTTFTSIAWWKEETSTSLFVILMM